MNMKMKGCISLSIYFKLMRTIMQDYYGKMKKSGRNHGIMKSKLREYKLDYLYKVQVLQKPHERNEEHLKLRKRKRGNLRPKNKLT
jgi:hypothetical protein